MKRLSRITAFAAGLLLLQGAAHADSAETQLQSPNVADERMTGGETVQPLFTPGYSAKPTTMAELTAMSQALVQRVDRERIFVGARVNMWFIDEQRGLLAIGIDDIAAVPAGAIVALGGHVEFFNSPSFEAAYSRVADTSPWYGGIRLTSTSGQQCTAAFNILAANVRYLLTAGHCGTHSWQNNGTTVGSTSYLEYTSGGWDTQYLNLPSSSSFTYTGCPACSTTSAVVSTASIALTGGICISGSFTGEQCGATVTSRNTCIPTNQGTSCHVSIASPTNGSTVLCDLGDSGGPAYNYATGGVRAAGVILAKSDTGGMCAYHEMDPLLAHLGASLLT